MNTICEDDNVVIWLFLNIYGLKISQLYNDCMYMISYCLIGINYKFCDIIIVMKIFDVNLLNINRFR